MSFVPYEHVVAHDSPVYVGESTKSTEHKVPFIGDIREVNMVVLGKRKQSTSTLSYTTSSQKDLESATSPSTTSPSRLLKRSAGPSTFTASASDAFTIPAVIIHGPSYSSLGRVTAANAKAPERSISPRSSDIASDSSLFVGPTFLPAARGGKSSPSSPPHTEPSLHDTTKITTQKGHLEGTRIKSEEPAEMRSQTHALLQSKDLGLSSKTNTNISEYVPRLNFTREATDISQTSQLSLGQRLHRTRKKALSTA